MSNYFSATYHCPACEQVIEQLVERDKRYEMIACPDCGGPAGPCVGAPMIARASIPDGYAAEVRGDGFRKLQEAAALKVELADTRPEKRADLQKEIRKLESLNPGSEK